MTRPQELCSPRHLLVPVETAANLLGISADELVRTIESGQSSQLAVVELPEGKYVEYESERT